MKEINRRFKLLVFAILLLSFSHASAQKIDHVIFFGDSLSDPGNHFIQTAQSTRPYCSSVLEDLACFPFTIEPPSASYDIGGHHFSNGNTWAEQLATALNLPTSGNPALRAPGLFTNYAVGGARARGDFQCSIPSNLFLHCGLSTQVSNFLADFGGKVPANSLIVIWIGSNDVDDAISAFVNDANCVPAPNPLCGAASAKIIQDAITAIATNAATLYGAGARMFLIANVPDLSKTPFVQALGASISPAIPLVASSLSNFFDQGFAQFAGGFAALPGLQFAQLLDVNALFGQLLASPGSFGLTNVTGRCTMPGVTGNAICPTPNQYLFWDAIHPTAAVHSAIAKAALQLLPPQ